MKNFCKFFLIVVWVVLVLGTGYYLVINNLSFILAADKPRLLFDCSASRIRIKTGRWVEVIKFDFPIKISRNHGIYIFKSAKGVLTVSTKPKFKIRLQKKL
jgi:hypothetical protein